MLVTLRSGHEYGTWTSTLKNVSKNQPTQPYKITSGQGTVRIQQVKSEKDLGVIFDEKQWHGHVLKFSQSCYFPGETSSNSSK